MRGILVRGFVSEYEKTNSLEEKANILKEVHLLSHQIIEDLYSFYDKHYQELQKKFYDGIIGYLIHDSRKHMGTLLFYIKELEKYEEKSQINNALNVMESLLPLSRTAFILLELLKEKYK